MTDKKRISQNTITGNLISGSSHKILTYKNYTQLQSTGPSGHAC